MKYYIPTSSMNLDNILQAESISPRSFYARRKTGYNSFEVIPELRSINQVVLFEYPVRFSINEPNYYNNPILIEIEDEQQLSNEAIFHCENGICLYNKTLHLTPYNCRIFFFSERAYKLVMINTKDNKSIKNCDKYHIYPTVEKLDDLREMPLIKEHTDQPLGESCEIRNDKKKGLLYAYLLGQNMSLTPELARQKYLMQEIYNTIASINSYIKTDKRVPETYKEKLEEQLEGYKKIDKIEIENQATFNENFKKDTEQHEVVAEHLRELLEHWGEGLLSDLYRKLSNKWNIHMLPLVSELHSDNDFVSLNNYIETHTKRSIADYKKKMPKPSLKAVKVYGDPIAIEGKSLLNIVLNYIVDNKLTQDELAANRGEICSKIINQIKLYFINNLNYSEEQWTKDLHRTYALQLYNSIHDFHTSFSLNDANELKYGAEFKAIAAFLLRGDSVDDCLKYLLKNEVTDYSMPLSLWGALCGYMEINRDLLSEFLTDDTYKSVYEHLYGMEMYKATFNDTVQPNQYKSDDRVKTADYLFVVEQAKIKAVYSKLAGSLQSEKYVDIQKIEKSLKTCSKRQQPQCDKAKKIFELLTPPINNSALLAYLQEIKVSQKTRTKISKHFGGTSEISKSNKNKPDDNINFNDMVNKENKRFVTTNKNNAQIQPASLFDENQSTGRFLSDFNFLSNNEEFNILMNQIDRQWKKDLEWFITAYNHPKEYFHYRDQPSDNHTVIRKFVDFRKGKYKIVESFLHKTYNYDR